MQATKRSAVPLRVHYIWDAIQHASGPMALDIERLATVSMNIHKIPRGMTSNNSFPPIGLKLGIVQALEMKAKYWALFVR